MKHIRLSKENIDNIDLSNLVKYVEFDESCAKHFLLPLGKEPFKLIAYLSTVLDSPVLYDVGTDKGLEALALSYNSDKKVVTYDIYDYIPEDTNRDIRQKPNIKRKITNVLNDIDDIVQSDLIVLDLKTYDGLIQSEIIDALSKNGYKGLLLIDDIKLSQEMWTLWNDIEHTKFDLSDLGHWSGTGLVVFDDSRFQVTVDAV